MNLTKCTCPYRFLRYLSGVSVKFTAHTVGKQWLEKWKQEKNMKNTGVCFALIAS